MRAAGEEAARKAEEAKKAAEEAAARAEEVARVAEKAAEEAVAKAEAAIPRALVRQILSSREFMLFIVAVILGAVWAAVAISVGISTFLP